jgi:hypothetical protein
MSCKSSAPSITACGSLEAIRALHIPADPSQDCSLLLLEPSAAALSDALGGGLLDDAYYGAIGPDRYCLYLDEMRQAKHLEPNQRAAVLAARLGWENLRIRLHGDALLVGTDSGCRDTDVPAGVLAAARRAGLIAPREKSTDQPAPGNLLAINTPVHR